MMNDAKLIKKMIYSDPEQLINSKIYKLLHENSFGRLLGKINYDISKLSPIHSNECFMSNNTVEDY